MSTQPEPDAVPVAEVGAELGAELGTGAGGAPSDAQLLAATRAGDAGAYDELFRRHRQAAMGLAARYTTQKADREDIVAQAFTDIWQTIRNGRGPVDAFRPYLLTCVRRLGGAHATGRARNTEPLGDDAMQLPDTAIRSGEELADAHMILAAFAQLPERFRVALWHSVVEGEDAASIGNYLGLNANSTYATVHRAKEALRVAYLAQHLADAAPTCGIDREQLAAFVRGRLSPRAAAKVTEHLETCPSCSAKVAELQSVDIAMRSVIAPAILGLSVTAYHRGVRAAAGGLRGYVSAHLPWVAGAGMAAVAALVALVIALLPDAVPAGPAGAAGAPSPAAVPSASGGTASGTAHAPQPAAGTDAPTLDPTADATPSASPEPEATLAARAVNGPSSLEQSAVANLVPGDSGMVTLQTSLAQLGTLRVTLPEHVEAATRDLGTMCRVVDARTIECDAPAAPMTYDLPVRVSPGAPTGSLRGGTAVTLVGGQIAAGPIAVAVTVPDPC